MSLQTGDPSPRASAHVLIVEDDLAVAESVAEMVRHLGYTPTICGHADEVISFVKTNKVDLMLVDYRMPELTGLDLILMLEQDNWHIPFVMMTGYAETESRIPTDKRKAFIILKKPVAIDSLARAFEESLKPIAQAG